LAASKIIRRFNHYSRRGNGFGKEAVACATIYKQNRKSSAYYSFNLYSRFREATADSPA